MSRTRGHLGFIEPGGADSYELENAAWFDLLTKPTKKRAARALMSGYVASGAILLGRPPAVGCRGGLAKKAAPKYY